MLSLLLDSGKDDRLAGGHRETPSGRSGDAAKGRAGDGSENGAHDVDIRVDGKRRESL